MSWGEWFRKEVHAGLLTAVLLIMVAAFVGALFERNNESMPSPDQIKSTFCPTGNLERVQTDSKYEPRIYAIVCSRTTKTDFYEDYYELTLADIVSMVEKANK